MSEILREHLEYLTLKGRNALYRDALQAVVREGAVVADLGCGIGVLGLLALEAGAGKVYGVDHSDAIHLARETMARAGLGDRYECIPGSTFRTDLPEKADVLICDHIGYFGTDYGIVDLIRDARERMLRDGGRIVPDRLELHIAAVSSDDCLAKAEGWRAEDVPDQFRWLDDQAHNARYPHDFAPEELCSDGAPLGGIDLASGDEAILAFTAKLSITRPCRFDGLAGWFSAHLGGDVWMTNSPLDDAAIGRSQAFLPVTEPFAVREGDAIDVKVRAGSDGQLLAWTVTPPQSRGEPQTMSTWASIALAQGRGGRR